MSRYNSDVDFNEYLNGPDPIDFNAVCTDCGADYSKGAHDPTTWCDTCSDQRSRWADALEARLQAKANLTITRKKEVA